MEKITRENIDALNKALIETLKEFAEKHGLVPRARTNNWMIVATISGGKKYRVSGNWLKNRLK